MKTKKFFLRVFLILFSALLFFGCLKNDALIRAKNFIGKSEGYYQQAIAEYKKLLVLGKDQEKLYFELGRVYYDHGDLANAIEAFKNSSTLKARKFLAISYYRMGNFTQGLELFNKEEIIDEEYLYYYGLTCEKLNLFDQALENYKRLKEAPFKEKARVRIEAIEKEVSLASIKQIDPKVYLLLSNAPKAEEYPQAGALILYCDENIEVSPEGTQVSNLHYVVKLLNERGKANFSEAHIDYDSTYERVELEYARTIKPDGTVVDVGSRHIRDVSKYLNFPLYSNARAYIISFPEITEGAAIEYKVKIYRSELINKKDLVLTYPLKASEPIIAAKFNVTMPRERRLNLKIINAKYNDCGANLTPAIEEKDTRLIYRWEFKDIPQIIPESNMPPLSSINPTLLISTFNSWKEIYEWWWKLAFDKIKADTAIKDLVKELTKDKSQDEDKARAIYNFCAQKIRYVAVEYGQAGYTPHPASDIFKNKYGDCKDQAVLLVTMLKEAGFVSWPLLIATKDYYNLNQDFPAALFNHCIAALDLNDKIIFLDPTAETCSFEDLPSGDQGRKVLIFEGDTYKIQDTPLFPAGHNLNKQNLRLKINSDESIFAQKSVFTSGAYDQSQRYWLLYTQPELIQESLKVKIQDVSIGARLNNYEIKNLEDLNLPLVLSYNFQGPEYFTLAGNLRLLPQLAGLDTSLVAMDKRKYDIEFTILDTTEREAEIEIPRGFMIKYLPKGLSEDNPWLKFSLEYKADENRLYFRQFLELKKNIVLAEEYPDFKNRFEALAKKIKERIVLEKAQ